MLNILIDANIIVDVMTTREPFFDMSARVIDAVEFKIVDGYISATSVTNIYYIARRTLKDRAATRELFKKILRVVKVAAVSETEIFSAINLPWTDFEDAVQFTTAKSFRADYIVTRNVKDFAASEIPAVTPEEFCRILLDS